MHFTSLAVHCAGTGVKHDRQGEAVSTVDAAVLVATVEAVVLQDVQQARHLAEDENTAVARLQLRQQLIQQYQLACAHMSHQLYLPFTKNINSTVPLLQANVSAFVPAFPTLETSDASSVWYATAVTRQGQMNTCLCTEDVFQKAATVVQLEQTTAEDGT